MSSPTDHQEANFVSQLELDLSSIIENEEVSPDQAFLRLCIDYLGFSRDDGLISDGKNDCGIDFIDFSTTAATIIQAKSSDFPGKIDIDKLAGTSDITDIPRIRGVISDLDKLPPKIKANLRRLLVELKSAILLPVSANHRENPESPAPDPFQVTVYFCYLGKEFTAAAGAEFDKFDSSIVDYGGRQIQFTFIPVFIKDLIHEKWKQVNTRWLNRRNERREEFRLPVSGGVIRDSKSAVFFTKATDLVEAYREIGYQLFEANVRCEIKNSPVNGAIKKSILSSRGRSEFKHLNNGVTLICDNFQAVGPKENPTAFRITRPGVVNGLQTIKTLSDSTAELKEADIKHFQDNCEVLVRLHMQNSVKDFRDLVKSTNNQNTMKPRNLRSNEPEQIQFERLFSDLGWFYERKEGAWNAFNSDHKRWSTLHNKKPSDFKSGRLIKKVDNEEIAQCWLAFIGFSEQAVDQKRYIFQPESALYDLIFKRRTVQHGSYYNFRPGSEALFNEAEASAPSPHGLLFAYLVREYATQMSKTRKEIRDEALIRLNLSKSKKNDQDVELSRDVDYLSASIIRGMMLLFVEFSGLLFFKAFGAELHEAMRGVLRNESVKKIFETGDFTQAKSDLYDSKYAPDDVLAVTWEFYRHCVSQMISTSWLQNWQQAPNRSKFIYGAETRKPLLAEIENADRMFKRGSFTRIWTTKINECGGYGDYLKASLPLAYSRNSGSKLI